MREINQAGTLLYASNHALWVYLARGDYAAQATTQFDEVSALADEKGVLFWKALV